MYYRDKNYVYCVLNIFVLQLNNKDKKNLFVRLVLFLVQIVIKL